MLSCTLSTKLLLFFVQLWLLPRTGFTQSTFDVTILHTNDIHARFEQTDVYGGPCTQDLADSGMCFGGYARKATKIKEARQSNDNVLLLDSGEMMYGIPAWHETYGSLAASHFMNMLGYNLTVSTLKIVCRETLKVGHTPNGRSTLKD